VTLLSEGPFWREHVLGNWFMIDGFDGCCAYDESSRHEFGRSGALSFLIAGNAAVAYGVRRGGKVLSIGPGSAAIVAAPARSGSRPGASIVPLPRMSGVRAKKTHGSRASIRSAI
jgi:hypothetical protein